MRGSSTNNITFFAETTFRNRRQRFGIKAADRGYHMYTLGKTGMGKTTLMENLIISDIQNGNSIAVIDPHGDLAEKILDYIPKNRISDVIYFNPADLHYPPVINLLDNTAPLHRSLQISSILAVFKMLYKDFWGPRMEHVFRNTLLTALTIPGANLFTISRLLTDPVFRENAVGCLKDPMIIEFWEQEYNTLDKRQRNDVISPILNKIGQFLSDPLIRNIVGRSSSKIKFSDVIQNKGIFIANLAKGKIGVENASLLGSLLITQLQIAALSQADLPEDKRDNFFIFVDECQHFLSESQVSMMAEMRKYGLNLILANQHLDQLDDKIRSAILGNVGSLILFRIGIVDAKMIVEEFFPNFSIRDLLRLPKYHVVLKLMIDGVVSEGFSAKTLPSQGVKQDHRDQIIQLSCQKYCSPISANSPLVI